MSKRYIWVSIAAYFAQISRLAYAGYTGDGTFYNLGSSTGNCGFEAVSAIDAATVKQLPWASGIDTFVAINNAQYNGSLTCGQCLVYHGTGSGLGTTPIAQIPQYGFVSDSCPGIYLKSA